MSHGFTYNASAIGLGGVLNVGPHGSRTRTILPSAASVALSPTGGEGRSIVENYSNHGVSFNYAQSTVIGYEAGGAFVTNAQVVITGLNVLDRLRVAMMQATIESRHDNGSEATFTTVHATYSGVEVDGVIVEPQLDLTIGADCPTFAQLETKLKNEKHIYGPRFGMLPNDLDAALRATPKPQVCGSLVADFVRPGVTQPVTKRAYGLQVQNFGRAHFAEYHVKPGRRRITLLRLDLDSLANFPDHVGWAAGPGGRQHELDGTISIASTDGNGSPPWKP